MPESRLHLVVDASNEVAALFSTLHRAETFIEERGVRDARVEERPVTGVYEYPAPVHLAFRAGSRTVNDLLGLFSDDAEARRVAGDDGAILTLKPDSKAVEDMH